LSAVSRRSLQLQGGVMSAGEARDFSQQQGAIQALALRRWDDQAKTAGLSSAPLEYFLERARRCLKSDQS